MAFLLSLRRIKRKFEWRKNELVIKRGFSRGLNAREKNSFKLNFVKLSFASQEQFFVSLNFGLGLVPSQFARNDVLFQRHFVESFQIGANMLRVNLATRIDAISLICYRVYA